MDGDKIVSVGGFEVNLTGRAFVFAAVSSAVVAFAFQPAQAAAIDLSNTTDVAIYLKGNGPSGGQLPDLPDDFEQKIFLTAATGVNTGFGNIGANAACPVSGPCVNFTSSSLINLANGFSNIKPNGSTYHDLTISVPGFTFGDLLFGVQLQKDDVPKNTPDPVPLYDLKITAMGTSGELGHAYLTNPTVNNSGLMSFLVLADSSTITSLILTSTYGIGGVFGFDETKEFQISDVALLCTENCNPGGPGSATPLPAAVWLVGTVLAGGAGFGRWRKRRQARMATA